MLYIELNRKAASTYECGWRDDDGPPPFIWHVGEKVDPQFRDEIPEVLQVQADGDELEWIIEKFTNGTQITIPLSTMRDQRWFGDIAKQIADVVIRANS